MLRTQCIKKNVMVIELVPSLGSRLLVVFFTCVFLFFVRHVTFEFWSRSALYYWGTSSMSFVCALLSFLGEEEKAVLDKDQDSVWLEKKLPFRSTIVLSLGKLSDLVDGAGIEIDPTLPHLQRLVLRFEEKTFPVTDSFVDVRRGLMSSGGGLKEAKAAVKNFLK